MVSSGLLNVGVWVGVGERVRPRSSRSLGLKMRMKYEKGARKHCDGVTLKYFPTCCFGECYSSSGFMINMSANLDRVLNFIV